VLKISGPERDEIRGDWKKLHIEECHNLYSSTKHYENDQIKKDEIIRAYSAHGREVHIFSTGSINEEYLVVIGFCDVDKDVLGSRMNFFYT
jgi:hypothetical protein